VLTGKRRTNGIHVVNNAWGFHRQTPAVRLTAAVVAALVLPKPNGYFGTEMIFGVDSPHGEDFEESDGLNMIRRVEDDEAEALRRCVKHLENDKKRGLRPVWS